MASAPRLVTERLILRLAETGDVPSLIHFFTANAGHFAPTSPLLPPGFLTGAYWRDQVVRNRDDFDAGRAVKFFLFLRDDPDVVIGGLSLNTIVRGAAYSCDLGYSLAADRQGQGLMSEAVAAAIRYAFDELHLHRVKAAYLPSNERSGRLLRRLGFVVEGYARDYLLIQGRWQDQVLVGLTNPEWRAPE
ncbi:MAG: GNAT family N-acetyltransferase [Chloroflexota bacterium]|nr:GNAT family N-acetyltransferase [Chloroflexota bacterium]